MVDIKFCGLTRPQDAARAAGLGARYAGTIFAGGPRLVDAARAKTIYEAIRGTPVRKVGVFGAQSPAEILRITREVAFDVIQLHGDSSLDDIRALREGSGGEVWVVARIDGTTLPAPIVDRALAADALVLDAKVPGVLGGTGMTLAWDGLRDAVAGFRARAAEAGGRTRLVLAGGLTPANVARAVGLVRPDVVDVSSGVEEAPGVKDPELMDAFARAARGPVDEER